MAITTIEPYVLDSTGNFIVNGITVSGITNLGSIANVKITGGSVSQVLTTDGTGNLSWQDYAQTTISPFLLMGAS